MWCHTGPPDAMAQISSVTTKAAITETLDKSVLQTGLRSYHCVRQQIRICESIWHSVRPCHSSGSYSSVSHRDGQLSTSSHVEFMVDKKVQRQISSPSISVSPLIAFSFNQRFHILSVSILTVSLRKKFNIVLYRTGIDSETTQQPLLESSFVNSQSIEDVARQRPAINNVSTVGSGVFYVSAPRQYHSTDRVELVSAGSEKLLDELVGNCSSVVVRCCFRR